MTKFGLILNLTKVCFDFRLVRNINKSFNATFHFHGIFYNNRNSDIVCFYSSLVFDTIFAFEKKKSVFLIDAVLQGSDFSLVLNKYNQQERKKVVHRSRSV